MKKEELLGEFLEKKSMILEIKGNYKRIIDYYDKSRGYGFLGAKIIFDFIESNYYQLSIDDEINIKQWIENIKDYNHNDYIYDLISVFNVDDTEQYSIFQKYADIVEDDYDQDAILADAQYNGYNKLFEEIKEEFIKFLNGKI